MKAALTEFCLSSLCFLAFVTAAAPTTHAQTVRRALPQRATPRNVPPLLDDAELHDVHFVGERHGWAVGDRGVIWRTDDGGQSWTWHDSGVDCTLRSVCFLTDRVGWVAGGGITPHVKVPFGVISSTTDGGQTWTRLVDRTLPLIHAVQFFDLENGIVVCESTSRSPSGVLRTSDGGQTWERLPGPVGESWRTGAFIDADNGSVAGLLGRFTSVSGRQVKPPLAGATGLRGIMDVTLMRDGHGWMAGDGGLVFTSDNAGVSWKSPPQSLPRKLRDAMDFRAVAADGDQVWLAGMPGSVVWHSTDSGRTWAASATGDPTPINALHFASETRGWAVGAMGRILMTDDGGQTWTAVRGGGRRAALLAIHAHERRVSVNLLKKHAADDGYRAAVTVMARRDIGPDDEAGRTLGLRLADAVSVAGGNSAIVDWAFPVAAPELDHHLKQLIREWQLLTDNRLREVMLTRLIVQLRTWRPDVLIVDDPPADDATTKLLGDAIKLAASQAADQLQGDMEDLLHLAPWQIKRVFRRLPDGSAAAVAIDAFEFLPRQGATVSMAAAEAFGRLELDTTTNREREAYDPVSWPGLTQDIPGRNLFAGLVLTPGSEARRALAPIDERDLSSRLSLASQQRNFAAYIDRMLDDDRHAAQLVGQTKDIVDGAPPEQAAVQLANLADEYRRRGEWEHAQATLFELAERYPEQPVTLEALGWLFHFTSSAEVTWQRLRTSSRLQRSETHLNGQMVQSGVRQAIEQARSGTDSDEAFEEPSSAIRQTSVNGDLRFVGGIAQQEAKRRQWREQAVRLAELLKRSNATFFAEPEIQFPLAALERSQKHPGRSDEIVNAFLSETTDGPWNRIATGELWLAAPSALPPDYVVLCHRITEPPYLDARHDDTCWIRATPIALRTDQEHHRSRFLDGEAEEQGAAVVQLAYDDRFLYVAAGLPRSESVKAAPVELPGRTDDADLSGQDRVSLLFDVDRDYATYYRFDVDQRGWTADACWENKTWNGRRFIAVDADSTTWWLEMAIPFEELVPRPPQSGETWAAGFVRIIPTVGVESWTPDAGTEPKPQTFGLVRFE